MSLMNEKVEDSLTMYNTLRTWHIKHAINQWLATLKPTYFLSVQFPMNMRTSDFDQAQEHLRKIMKNFERQLLGRHWHKKPLPFMATAEHGESRNWHFHALFYDCPFAPRQLRVALNRTIVDMRLTPETFDLQHIKKKPAHVHSYCTKEIRADINSHFDSTQIIPHEVLFNLPSG